MTSTKRRQGRLTALDSVHVDLSAKFRRVEGKDDGGPVGDAIALLNKLATGAVELERALGSELRDYPPRRFCPMHTCGKPKMLRSPSDSGWALGLVVSETSFLHSS